MITPGHYPRPTRKTPAVWGLILHLDELDENLFFIQIYDYFSIEGCLEPALGPSIPPVTHCWVLWSSSDHPSDVQSHLPRTQETEHEGPGTQRYYHQRQEEEKHCQCQVTHMCILDR